jgi:hypothetical protein
LGTTLAFVPKERESPSPPSEHPAWTCARCERVLDFQNEAAGQILRWRILGGVVLCPDCVTDDDIVANRTGEFWFDSRTATTRIACRCGADLGPIPETKPTDVDCVTCYAVWTITGKVGYTLRAKWLPPL